MKWFNKGDIHSVLLVRKSVRTRSNALKLDNFKISRTQAKNWFANRVVGEWNRLNIQMVSANTIVTFENSSDIFINSGTRGGRLTVQPDRPFADSYVFVFLCSYDLQNLGFSFILCRSQAFTLVSSISGVSFHSSNVFLQLYVLLVPLLSWTIISLGFIFIRGCINFVTFSPTHF